MPAHSLRYAVSIWYNDTKEILADTDEEVTDAEKEVRMARVLQSMGITGASQ